MSIQAVAWAFDVPIPGAPKGIATSAMRFALVALANYANQDGRCWPKMTTLAANTALSERHLRRALTALEETGLIRREERRRDDGTRLSSTFLLAIHPDTMSGCPVPEHPDTMSGTYKPLDLEPSLVSPTAKPPPAGKPEAKARPSIDSVYLAVRINETWEPTRGHLSVAGLQKLANRYGAGPLEDALRELHGFPPSEAVRSPFAYLGAILRSRAEGAA